MDKLFGGSPQSGANDDIPWWMRYAGRGVGIAGGIVAIVFGVMCAVSISPLCIIAGILQICAGAFVLLCEMPFCLKMIPPLAGFGTMVEDRPPWQKATAYLVLALIPICLCAGMSTIIGGGCIFTTAVIYGMMTLGRKASRDEMAAMASGAAGAAAGPPKSESMNSGLVGNIYGQDVEAAKAANANK